jgi:hypothetical protein
MADHPLARTHDLVVKSLGDETLVYDVARHRAHSLNASAAALWRACDGRRSVATLATAVRAETGHSVTDAAVEYGLAALNRARLLAGGVGSGAGMNRRGALRGMAAVAVPFVVSIAAPVAAQVQSCAAEGASCDANGTPEGNCCPGLLCINGTVLCANTPGPNCTCLVT